MRIAATAHELKRYTAPKIELEYSARTIFAQQRLQNSSFLTFAFKNTYFLR